MLSLFKLPFLLFCKLEAGFHLSFTEEKFPSSHSAIKPRSMECYSDGFPSGSISHPHMGYWSPLLGRVLVVPNFFQLRLMDASVLLETFKAAEICSLPHICNVILSLSSAGSSFELMA